MYRQKQTATGHAAKYIAEHPVRECYGCGDETTDRDSSELKVPGQVSWGSANTLQFKGRPWCQCGHVFATVCSTCATNMVEKCTSCYICKSPVRAWNAKGGGLQFRADAAVNRVYKCSCSSKLFRGEAAVTQHHNNPNPNSKGCSGRGSWIIIDNDD